MAKAATKARKPGSKPAAKKSTARKSTAKPKTPARKTTAKPKAPARKTTARKTTAKRKAPARKTTAKKTTAKKAPAKRKTAAKKTPAKRKTAAKKTTAKRKAPAKRKIRVKRKPAAPKKSAAKRTARKKVVAKAAAAQPEIKRIRTAKGRRPYFFDDPNVDKLLAMLMALTGEVSVIRERLDTHERLAEKKKFSTSANIEAYRATEVVDQERVKWRADYVARILRIVTDELEQITRKESNEQYENIVKEVAR